MGAHPHTSRFLQAPLSPCMCCCTQLDHRECGAPVPGEQAADACQCFLLCPHGQFPPAKSHAPSTIVSDLSHPAPTRRGGTVCSRETGARFGAARPRCVHMVGAQTSSRNVTATRCTWRVRHRCDPCPTHPRATHRAAAAGLG